MQNNKYYVLFKDTHMYRGNMTICIKIINTKNRVVVLEVGEVIKSGRDTQENLTISIY